MQSAVATAADAHTDSGGLHITAHLLHTVQDTSGQWCVERVMERETLSNNTEYQERLREGRIRSSKIVKQLKQERQQLQQQVSVTFAIFNNSVTGSAAAGGQEATPAGD